MTMYIRLSERQTEVLQLIADGSRPGEITDELSIGTTTFKREVAMLLSILGAKNKAHAVAWGMRWGIIK